MSGWWKQIYTVIKNNRINENTILIISENTLSAMSEDNYEAFKQRLDAWLCDECPQYAGTPKTHRETELEKMLKSAKSARMDVEIDYAVFCHLCINAVFEPNIDFSAPLEDSMVKKILRNDVKPREKLSQLETFFNARKQERG